MKRLTLFQALSWIILSTLVVTPSVYTGVRFFQKKRQEHLTAPIYLIQSIAQASSIKRALNSAFFAERLGLAADMPQNIYRFDAKLAEKILLDTAVIKEVKVQKQYPNTLYIEYEMRIPLVKIGEYDNVAIDQEGVVFPLVPFFARQKIPEVYLGTGIEQLVYNQPLSHPRLQTALQTLVVLQRQSLIVEKVDVSKEDFPSYGRREIIAVVATSQGKHFLRLSTKELEKQLSNYLSLQEVLGLGDKVIDLRIDNIAYIDKVNYE